MPKRPRDIFDTPVSSSSPPYVKRVDLMGTSASASSSVYSSPLKPYSTPLAPADSPTNPFSLRLNHVVTLPKSLSFTKHIGLRFQLVLNSSSERNTSSKSSSVYRHQIADPYRIVHVPSNYSFKLIYKLIRFLFDLTAGPDHVFEVQDEVEMYANLSAKRGRIKKGRTCIKLSRNFDDQLKRIRGAVGSSKKPKKDATEDDCQWEGEDDFTLATAWSNGLVKERAIIYRHDLNCEVHITMNLLKFPTRKGRGNKPFVFLAEDLDTFPIVYNYWNGREHFEDFLRTSAEEESEFVDDDDDDDILPQSIPSSDPFAPETPFPSAPLLKMRLDSAHRRMSRKVPRMKGDYSDEDESDYSKDKEQKEEAAEPKEKEKVKVDDKEKEQEHDDNWDPFGDEAEL